MDNVNHAPIVHLYDEHGNRANADARAEFYEPMNEAEKDAMSNAIVEAVKNGSEFAETQIRLLRRTARNCVETAERIALYNRVAKG
jgi:hypothetical protein